ncbi:hypothetical protein AB0J21_25185 [Streptomyces sp. NPDC049954]|uniref:hypothetical protein n=1 Tax=Streptomyces sp. NPDC049954 TaxID=3155779 RepID=UPI00342845D1
MSHQQPTGFSRRRLMAGAAAGTALAVTGQLAASATAEAAAPAGGHATGDAPRQVAGRKGLFLPKNPPTRAVLVYDVSQDIAAQDWEAKEALLASVALQGLINRTGSVKVYFTHTPQEHYWKPFAADVAALEDGLIPAGHSTPRLDRSKKYPVLSHLAATYLNGHTKGAVRYPALSDKVVDGAVTAAVTAAGQLDLVPLSPAVEAYLKAEGHRITVREDTTTLSDNVVAYHWAKDRFLGEHTNRSFVGQHSFTAFGGGVDDQVPVLYDYFVSHRAFVFSLDANDPEQAALIPDLLNPGNFPVGTPVIGLPVDEGAGLRAMQEAGYFFTIANTPNTTVTSSFEARPAPVPAARPAKPRTDGVYVAFYATDGDSVGFSTNYHYEWWRKAGKNPVPIAWSFNPQLVDLYPTMLRWRSRHNAGGAYELVADFNDGGAPVPQDARTAWSDRFRAYLDEAGSALRTVNYFYLEGTEGGDQVSEAVGRDLVLRKYCGVVPGDARTGAYTLRDGALLTIDLQGRTQADATVENIEAAVREAVAATPEGEPCFAAVCVGDGRFQDIPANVATVAEALLAQPDGRHVEFVTPSVLAATWRAHHDRD